MGRKIGSKNKNTNTAKNKNINNINAKIVEDILKMSQQIITTKAQETNN